MLIKFFNNFRKEFLIKRRIVIFDLDDTLVKTKTFIKIHNPQYEETLYLTSSEFNHYSPKSEDTLDFSEFNNVKNLLEGEIMPKYFDIMKREAASGEVAIVSARADDKPIKKWLQYHKIQIKNEHVITVSHPRLNKKTTIQERKKEAVKKFILKGYTDIIFYDDSEKNLQAIDELKKEFPRNIFLKRINIKTFKASG